MAQAGYTPIQLYYSTTASATPSAGNLVAGELALNTLDEKLYFKNSSGTVKLLASVASTTNVASISFGSTGLTPSTATTGAVTVAGTLAVANGGTGITAFGTGVATALGQNVSGSGGIALTTSPVFTTPNLGTPSAVTLTNATGLPLSTGVTGTLGISSGGTGQTTASTAFNALSPLTTLGDILYGGASGAGTRLGIGTAGQVLTVSGGIPAWSTPASGGVTTISFGSTGLTPSTATSGAVSVAGTLAVANGGTGITSFGTGVATALGQNVTGSGGIALATSASLTTPALSGETFSTSATVSAAGTTQGTATALTSDYNVVTTVAASAGVALPTATTGRKVRVVNKGANALAIYPATGGTIDALAANASISLAVNGTIEFNASSTTQWYSTSNSATAAGQITGTLSLTTQVTGTLPVANGGTGSTTLTANSVMLGNGTSALSSNMVAPGTAGNVLTSNGTTWVSQAASSGGGQLQFQLFAASGSWTCPAGVTRVRVIIFGGGAGGRNGPCSCPAGGTGGGGWNYFTVTPSTVYSVTIGSGGANGNPPAAGGTSSFGALISATGGSIGSGNTDGADGSCANSLVNTTAYRYTGTNSRFMFIGNQVSTSSGAWAASKNVMPGARGEIAGGSGIGGAVLVEYVG